MEKKLIEQKKKEIREKINNFTKNKYNMTFLVIMILAVVIRLYYFVLTNSQPLWWDESDYMAYAKNLAGLNVDWVVTPQHNSLFSYIAAGFMKIGFQESSIKFILVVLPSIMLVYLTYKICIILYKDKRIALISSFLMAVFWNILFNSFRFHIDVPALFFAFLAIYIFFQGYEKKEKIFEKIDPKWATILTGILIILAYSIRRAYILFGVFLFFYLIITHDFKKILKDKFNWIATGVVFFLFFLVEKFIFISSIGNVAQSYSHLDRAINWDTLGIFNIYFNNLSGISILFYLFIVGVIISSFHLILFFDYIRKEKFYNIKGDLFITLSFLITLFYFIFYQRDTIGDPRWYFPMILGSFISISKGTLFISDCLKKYSKNIAIILIIVLIGYGGVYELQHADQIIKMKIPSFEGIKQAGLFLGEIASNDDIILSIPVPQPAYYSEKKVRYVGDILNKSALDLTFEEFLEALKKEENKNIKYLIVTFSEPNHAIWMRKDRNGIIEIPFMNTTIDFIKGQHDIKRFVSYNNISFNLINIKEDAFIYEIVRK